MSKGRALRRVWYTNHTLQTVITPVSHSGSLSSTPWFASFPHIRFVLPAGRRWVPEQRLLLFSFQHVRFHCCPSLSRPSFSQFLSRLFLLGCSFLFGALASSSSPSAAERNEKRHDETRNLPQVRFALRSYFDSIERA